MIGRKEERDDFSYNVVCITVYSIVDRVFTYKERKLYESK